MKEGFKTTSLGIIPEDWEVESLGDLVEITSGASPSDFCFSSEGVFNFYKVNQLNDYEKYMKSSPYKFDLNSKGSNLRKNSIVFPKRGASIFTNKVRILSEDAFVDTNIMALHCNNRINYEFLYYFLIKFELSNIADTSSIPQINNKHIIPLRLALPPFPEQQKIGEILSTVDEKIEVIGEQIEQTQELKKGLMQRLLTKGIGHTQFKDSPIGEIPDSWEVVRLSEVSYKITDGSHFSPVPLKDSPFYIGTVKDMRVSDFNINSCAQISEADYNSLVRNGCKPEIGDILLSKDGTIGKTFVFDGNQDLVLLSSIAIIKLIKDKAFPDFVCQVLKSPVFLNQLEGLKSGSAIRRLVLKAIKEIKIPIPSLSEQIRLAELFSKVDEKIDVLKEKKAQYQELKKGLMQQLLTGKMRVNHLIEQPELV